MTWEAMRRSISGSIWSSTTNNRSKRLNKESGNPIFSWIRRFLSYCPYTGFAAARTEHLALRLACIPALAIVTVCCSMASWMATLSASLILSNSSTQTIPRSASTIAPASNLLSLVSGSEVTAAVKPTPLDPLPVVDTARGAIVMTDLNNWLLAVEGSPTMSIFTSPLKWVPLSKFFSTPLNNCNASAFLITAWPWILGARLLPSTSKISPLFPKDLIILTSSGRKFNWLTSLPRICTLFTNTTVLNKPLVVLCPLALVARAR